MLGELDRTVRNLEAAAHGEEPRRWTIYGKPWDGTLLEWWATLDDAEHDRLVRRAREWGALDRWDPPVPSGTPEED